MTEEAKNPTEEKQVATMQELRPEAMSVLQTCLKADDPATALAAARIVIKSCDARKARRTESKAHTAWLSLVLVGIKGLTKWIIGRASERALVDALAAHGDTLGNTASIAANLPEKARDRLLQRVKEQDAATYHGLMALLIARSGKVTDADIPADVWDGSCSITELAASIEKLPEAERAVRLSHIEETCELVYHSIMAMTLKKQEPEQRRPEQAEEEVESCDERGECDCKPSKVRHKNVGVVYGQARSTKADPARPTK